MSDTTHIGLIHNKDLPNDAIHIAIAQVRAGEDMKAGDHVGFKEGNEVVFKGVNNIGIVDPFITDKVGKDCLCYLFLYPNTVTSLTHQWEHPLFNRTPERIAAAEKWLIRHCDEENYNWEERENPPEDEWEKEYDNLKHFKERHLAGDWWYGASGDRFADLYNNNEDDFRKKFWDNLEIVTGKLATKENRAQTYFSCSC